ncbi:MAG TPA: DUF4157 domain-containing protein [Terriglobales bacterium]|nr:DUF4157 domain-containing protein [Terriglobales bacterium]
MNERIPVTLQKRTTDTEPILRRKCACGGSGNSGGECAECQKKKLQRRATGSGAETAPSIVQDVLRSPGQPLDASTRSFFEPRFGSDFSKVRVHTDAEAADSARVVSALAYTVGPQIVFGAGLYQPNAPSGKQLLAHELTHVMQQGNGVAQGSLAVGPVEDSAESEAATVSDTVGRGDFLDSRPASRTATAGFLRRAPVYRGNILDEGTCEHLACRSMWACPDESGVECPAGTEHDFAKTKKKFVPLMSCDRTCDKTQPCTDGQNWMAIPAGRFAFRKCDQDLVICANSKFTHATVRDKSRIEAWEVSHGVQDDLSVSPYASFTGSIYGDVSDPGFKTDKRCGQADSKGSSSSVQDAGSPEQTSTSQSDAGAPRRARGRPTTAAHNRPC